MEVTLSVEQRDLRDVLRGALDRHAGPGDTGHDAAKERAIRLSHRPVVCAGLSPPAILPNGDRESFMSTTRLPPQS